MIQHADEPETGADGTADGARRLLVATDLVLKDQDGVDRVLISGGNKDHPGPAIVMLDERGNPRLRMGLSNTPTNSPRLTLYDQLGKGRVDIAVNDHEDATQASIMLYDGEERPRVGLMAPDKGAPVVTIFDSAGTDRIIAGLDSDDQPFLAFLDDSGDIIPGAVLPQAILQALARCQDCQKHQCPSGQPTKDDEQKGPTP